MKIEIIERIKSPTPKFFKKMKWIAGIIVTVAVALLGADAAGQIVLSETMSSACVYVSIIGASIFSTATTTIE